MAESIYGPRALRFAFQCFARGVFRFYTRLGVAGRAPLPRDPFLLCSNHTSHLDSAALMVATGLPFDRFRLLAAADYFERESTAGRLTRAVLNIVTVDRRGGHALALRHTVSECDELIRTHQVRLIAFPEGTRSTTGALLPFKAGSAFLAVALALPIVPAYIEGAHRALPKGRWVPRPGRIRVHFGRPIWPADWSAIDGQRARWAYVTGELEHRIRALAADAAV